MKYFEYKNIKVKFNSIGGIESCYILPDFKVAFDIGRCPQDLIDIPSVFLSHGHLDHASGLSYYFSQRSLKNLGPGTIYVPSKIFRPLKKITKQWQKIEEFDYKSNLEGLKPGHEIKLQDNLSVIAIKAIHRVSALGYVIMQEVKKLKEEYSKLPGKEIAELKKTKEIFDTIKKPVFAYSGDSTIEIVRDNPLMREAKVLFMECTYIDEKRSIERARKWGHTHLDEILANREWFNNEKVVLIHLSRRYSSNYIQFVLNNKLKDQDRDKFVIVS